jgi:hypothetical protein
MKAKHAQVFVMGLVGVTVALLLGVWLYTYCAQESPGYYARPPVFEHE